MASVKPDQCAPTSSACFCCRLGGGRGGTGAAAACFGEEEHNSLYVPLPMRDLPPMWLYMVYALTVVIECLQDLLHLIWVNSISACLECALCGWGCGFCAKIKV
eukprot:scaffold146619_cov19-Tisochrysis_lutea.AAC.3